MILFLGNSHLSAFKLAYDDLCSRLPLKAKFFCARGADLAFTEIFDGKIRTLPSITLSKEQLYFFYGELKRYPNKYLVEGKPSRNVYDQFVATGGAPEIDLTAVKAIFYVAGMSPYDFIRVGINIVTAPHSQQIDFLRRLLGTQFFLYPQIMTIKAAFPTCKHYFIGRPLASFGPGGDDFLQDPLVSYEQVVQTRDNFFSHCDQFLFDGVFQPGGEVLTKSLLFTKQIFCIDGRMESQIWQNDPITTSDHVHMNRLYGHYVFRDFIVPIVKQL